MSDVVIRLKNVSKFYKLYKSPGDRLKEALNPLGKLYHKDFYALNNINLEVRKGEILGVVGKNGCGKSTLLKLISGVLSPNDGEITVNGKISALLELGSGFNPEFTGMQNIFFYCTILGLTQVEIQEKMDSILEFADIGDFIHQPLKTYSSGMKSRLGFSVAVNVDPEILILDEVLAVGDDLFRRKCFAKMEQFFQNGKTVIYVSHNINSVNRLCSRAIFIDSGCLLMDSNTKLVTSYYQKYIFSTDENKTAIKEEIAKLHEDPLTDIESIVLDDAEGEVVTDECYLPGLVSKTVVELKNHNVAIDEIRLLNGAGSKVNVLGYASNYSLNYKISFEHQVDLAITSFAIRDLKGLVISSATSDSPIPICANNGSAYNVKWSFLCKLLPGTYYINIAVREMDDNGVSGDILIRIVDVILFKVVSNKLTGLGGLVGLDQNMTYSKI